MNVLVLNHTAQVGGASKSLTIQLSILSTLGFNIIILTPPGPLCSDWEKMGHEVIYWKPPICIWFGKPVYSSGLFEFKPGLFLSLLFLPMRIISAIMILRGILSDNRIKYIYINTLILFPLGVYIKYINNKFKFQVIWHIRELINKDLFYPIFKFIQFSVHTSSSAILAITSNEAEMFRHTGKVKILHNVPSSDQLPSMESITTEKRVFMACAFLPGKGIPLFFKIANIVKEHSNDVQFFLFTNRPVPLGKIDKITWWIFSRINDAAKIITKSSWQLENCILDKNINIIFDKHLNLSDYKKCRIYLRADESGCPWGRDIIEAMSVGVPIVATGSNEEFIINGETGFLVPSQDPNVMAERIISLLNDTELHQFMSNNAYRRSQELFSLEKYKDVVRNIFKVDNGFNNTHSIV